MLILPLLFVGLAGCEREVFVQVVTADEPCARTSRGRVACPSNGLDAFRWQPLPPVTHLQTVDHGICALSNQGVECWESLLWPEHLDRSFRALAADSNNLCGLDDEGYVECWHRESLYYSQWLVPVDPRQSRPWASVSTGLRAICGLDDDGAVECFMTDGGSLALPGTYDRIEVGGFGGNQICGLADGVPTCTGGDEYYDPPPPDGVRFKSIHLGYGVSCGITRTMRSAAGVSWTATTRRSGTTPTSSGASPAASSARCS